MSHLSTHEPADGNSRVPSSGRYRFCAGRALDPSEGIHPELIVDDVLTTESSGVPDSPAALIAMQNNPSSPRAEKPERGPSAKVEQVLALMDRLDTSASEDLELVQRLVRKLEHFHDHVVNELCDDKQASHSQLIAWAIDADRLMRSRILLESVDLD